MGDGLDNLHVSCIIFIVLGSFSFRLSSWIFPRKCVSNLMLMYLLLAFVFRLSAFLAESFQENACSRKKSLDLV